MNGTDKQKLLISYLMAEPSAYAMCRGIMSADYFSKELQPVVSYILGHSDKYNAIPNAAMIAAETGVTLDYADPNEHPNRIKWVCDEVEKHCRLMATYNAVIAASDMIHAGDIEGIVEPIKRAVMTSLQRDLGTDYFQNPYARLRKMMDTDSAVPTGYKHLDQILYGGVMRGGVNVFAAESGGGKSLMLANLCVNAIKNGKNAVYITLELPETWVAKRIDSMMTGIASQQIFSRVDEVHGLLMKQAPNCGQLRIKYMPANSSTNDIRAYLKSLELEFGFIPEVLAIDYLDLVRPTEKVDINNISLKDKYTTEELRSLCIELACLCYTASQTTKGADGSEGYKQGDMAGGKTKVNTADNVIALYQPLDMKEDGYIELQLVKTRTSSGQGRRVRLRYNMETVRFTDADDDKAFPVGKGKSTRAGASQPSRSPVSSGPDVGAESGTSNLDRIEALKRKLSR